mgnify:CR=1 FL=1
MPIEFCQTRRVPALPGGMLALLKQNRALKLAIGINGDGVAARADLRARRQPRNVIEAFGAVRLQLVPGFQQYITVLRRPTSYSS